MHNHRGIYERNICNNSELLVYWLFLFFNLAYEHWKKFTFPIESKLFVKKVQFVKMYTKLILYHWIRWIWKAFSRQWENLFNEFFWESVTLKLMFKIFDYRLKMRERFETFKMCLNNWINLIGWHKCILFKMVSFINYKNLF